MIVNVGACPVAIVIIDLQRGEGRLADASRVNRRLRHMATNSLAAGGNYFGLHLGSPFEEMIAYARQKAGVSDDFKPIRLSLSKSLSGSDDLLRGRLSVAFSAREKTRKLMTISIDLENGQVTSRRESSSGREESCQASYRKLSESQQSCFFSRVRTSYADFKLDSVSDLDRRYLFSEGIEINPWIGCHATSSRCEEGIKRFGQ